MTDSEKPPIDPSPAASAAVPQGPPVGAAKTSKTRRAPQLTEDDCVAKLEHLVGLVTLKHLTTAQANSIHSVYRTILDAKRQRGAQRETQLSSDGWAAAVQKDPSLLNLLAPLLTDDQMEGFLQQLKEERDEEA
jgi:hypothetical protein